MRKIVAIIVLLMIAIPIFGQSNDNSPKVRIIVLNKIGQKEKVNSGERVSVVFGPSIKPEYTYINYSNGINGTEYIIELKSNESFLKEISSLQDALSKAKRATNTPSNEIDGEKDNKGETTISEEIAVHNGSNTKKNIQSNVPYSARAIHDTIQKKNSEIYENNIFGQIPNIQNSIEALNFIKKANHTAYDTNLQEYNKNQSRIDTINREIERITALGQDPLLLDALNRELNTLKLRNIEIEEINSTLLTNNLLLESEINAKDSEAKYLMTIIYSMLAFTIVILIFLAYIYISYRQKKKLNKLLEDANSELRIVNTNLNESNEEKAKLLLIIRKELDVATKYVQSLLPKPITTEYFKTDWTFIPSEALGGDIFGYNKIDDTHYAFYLLDVSGHGVAPSLHSVQASNILQHFALPNVDFRNPEDVLFGLNNIFQMVNYRGMYFTMCYTVYNTETKELKYASAGHPPMILLNGKGELELLRPQQLFVGAVPDLEFTSSTIKLEKDSTLYLFSDGIFELEKSDSSMYEFDEFTRDFAKIANDKNKGFKEFYSYAKGISGLEVLSDDFSILEVKFTK